MRYFLLAVVQLILSGALLAQQEEPLSITLSNDQYKLIEKRVTEKERAKQRTADWARFGRYSAMNDTLKKPVKFVFMGNSIAEGWERIRPEFFRMNAIVNRAISGQTTSHMLVRFQADVIELNPETVIIMAGTNDIAGNNGKMSHGHILQNIKSMCELARYNRIRPVLCSVLPASEFRWNPELKPADDIRQLNAMIAGYARKARIPYVDFYSVMVNDKGGLSEDIAPDGVHPVAKGYLMMEPVLQKVIHRFR